MTAAYKLFCEFFLIGFCLFSAVVAVFKIKVSKARIVKIFALTAGASAAAVLIVYWLIWSMVFPN